MKKHQSNRRINKEMINQTKEPIERWAIIIGIKREPSKKIKPQNKPNQTKVEQNKLRPKAKGQVTLQLPPLHSRI